MRNHASIVRVAKSKLPAPNVDIQGAAYQTTTRSLKTVLVVDAAMPELSCATFNISADSLVYVWTNYETLDPYGNVTTETNTTSHRQRKHKLWSTAMRTCFSSSRRRLVDYCEIVTAQWTARWSRSIP